MNEMFWSDTVGALIPKGFTRVKVRFYKECKKYKVTKMHFTWSEEDCLYWSDELDDVYYFEMPKKMVKPSRIEKNWNGYTTAIYYKAD